MPVGGDALAIAALGEARVGRHPSVSRRVAPVGEGGNVGASVLVTHLARPEISRVLRSRDFLREICTLLLAIKAGVDEGADARVVADLHILDILSNLWKFGISRTVHLNECQKR